MDNPAVSSRLIGAIFVERNLVTEEQLAYALEEQARSGGLLGEILVARFGVSRLELASALADQWAELERPSLRERSEPAGEAKPTLPELAAVSAEWDDDDTGQEPVQRRPLGEIFVEQGMITAEQLERALEEQRETGQKLGEILVAQGSLTRLKLASALADQWSGLQKLRPPAPVEPNGRLRLPGTAPAETPAPAESPELPDRLAQATENLRATLSSLGSRVAELEERIEAGAADELRGEVERLRAELAGRIEAEDATPLAEELRLEIGRLEERLAAAEQLSPRLDALETRSAEDELRQVLDALEDLSARIDAVAVGGRTHELEARLAALEPLSAEVEALRGLVDAAAQRDESAEHAEGVEALAPLAEAVEQLRGRVEGLAARDVTSGLEERLEQLDVRLEDLRGRVGSAPREEILELRQSVAALEARLGERVGVEELRPLVEAVEQLRGRLAALADRDVTSELTQRLEELERRPDTDGVLCELRGAVESLEARLAERAAVDEVRPLAVAVEQLRGRVEALAADDATGELAERVAVLEPLGAQLDDLRGRVEAAADHEESEELRRAVVALEARLAERAAVDEVRPLVEAVEQLRGRVEALAARDVTSGLEERLEQVDVRLEDLRGRVAAAADREESEELRRAVVALEARVAEREAVDELRPLVEAVEQLRGRVEALAARDVTNGLEERLAALEARPEDAGLEELQADVQSLGARLAEQERGLAVDRTDEVRAELADVRGELDAFTAAVERRLEAADALGNRLGALEARDPTAGVRPLVESLEVLRGRVDTLAASAEAAEAAELAERVAALERRPGADRALDDLRDAMQSVDARLADHERRLASDPTDEVRAELARLWGELETRDPAADTRRLAEALEERLQAVERRAGVDAVLDELGALTAQVDDVRRHVDAKAGRDDAEQLHDRVGEVTRALDELRGQFAGELDQLRAGVREEMERDREAELRALVDELERARVDATRVDELDRTIDELRTAVAEAAADTGREELRDAVEELGRRVNAAATADEVRAAVSALGARLDEAIGGDAVLAARADELERSLAALAPVAELRSVVDGRLAELERRLEEASGTEERLRESLGALLAHAVDELRGEGVHVQARLDEASHRLAELESAGGRLDALEQRLGEQTFLDEATRELRERLEALERRGAERAEAMQAQTDELVADISARIEAARHAAATDLRRAKTLARGARRELGRLHESLDARDIAIEDRLRDELRESLAGAADRSAIDELGAHLQAELATLRAQLDELRERGAEELRGELAQLAATLGGRVDLLAAAGGEELRRVVAELERRLEAQASLAEEQVRVTEEALRDGLASLGKRLGASEAAYADAGNALRRSIERLGDAITDTDLRLASRRSSIPTEEQARVATAHIAFVPVPEGYRLVARDGAPPAVGDRVVLPEREGELVVVRLGRSPLPLDERPCAYLEQG